MKNVLVLGKFRPMHVGHQAMISAAFGLAMIENANVHIIISDNDDQFLERYSILRGLYNDDRVGVYALPDRFTCNETDEYGTCLDEGFMEAWADAITGLITKPVTHLVTSDRYGEKLAAALDAEWVPFDPDRELFPVSATMIRNDPVLYWDYIVPEFRHLMGISVCVVGPESSGKSTLVKKLAADYHWYIAKSGYVPEYGRIYTDHKKTEWEEKDFIRISTIHDRMVRSGKQNFPILFVDTDKHTTYLFGKTYLNKELRYIKDNSSFQRYDHYLLLAPNVEWVQDGQRVLESYDDRLTFFNELKDYLDKNEFSYTIIDQMCWSSRFEAAKLAVNDAINEKIKSIRAR